MRVRSLCCPTRRPLAEEGRRTWKLILTAAVDHLGVAGDIVEVKDGYGRNYLLPQGYAIKWTRGAEKQIEGINRAREARTVRDNEHALQLDGQLEELSVELPARAASGASCSVP